MSDVADLALKQFLTCVSSDTAVLDIDAEVGLPVGRCFHDAYGSVGLCRAQPLAAFPQHRIGLLELRRALSDAPCQLVVQPLELLLNRPAFADLGQQQAVGELKLPGLEV